jgi:hypothetical protein
MIINHRHPNNEGWRMSVRTLQINNLTGALGELQVTKALALALLAASLFACARTDTAKQAVPALLPPTPSVAVKALTIFDVCATDNNCVSEAQALMDMYAPAPAAGATFGQIFGTAANLAFVRNVGLISIVNSVKYADGKVIEKIGEDGNIPSCHACAPTLGASVYQFHDKWNLIAKNPAVEKFGQWGVVGLTDKDIEIIPIDAEKFLIVLKSSSSGQGETGFQITVLGVAATMAGSPVPTLLGSIEVGNKDCFHEAGQGGVDWVGEVTYDKKTYPPEIVVSKKFYKNCTKELVPSLSGVVRYAFDQTAHSYLPSPN